MSLTKWLWDVFFCSRYRKNQSFSGWWMCTEAQRTLGTQAKCRGALWRWYDGMGSVRHRVEGVQDEVAFGTKGLLFSNRAWRPHWTGSGLTSWLLCVGDSLPIMSSWWEMKVWWRNNTCGHSGASVNLKRTSPHRHIACFASSRTG